MPDQKDQKEPALLTITPLGGYGEIGMNCTLLETGEDCVLIDCGLMFPEDYHLGVDVVIPRFDLVLEKKNNLRAVVLTHGHEDHIGALPWLVPHLNKGTLIFGSPFTLALVEHKLREHGLLDHIKLMPVEPGQRKTLGEIVFYFFPVSHSIIHGLALGMDTPAGRILHTGDFKIDPAASKGWSTDLDAYRRFCQDGLTLLMSDSTNIEKKGFRSYGGQCLGNTFRQSQRPDYSYALFQQYSAYTECIQRGPYFRTQCFGGRPQPGQQH